MVAQLAIVDIFGAVALIVSLALVQPVSLIILQHTLIPKVLSQMCIFLHYYDVDLVAVMDWWCILCNRYLTWSCR